MNYKLNKQLADITTHAKAIAKNISSQKKIVIVHHHDADGIASASILAKAFQNLGKSFSTVAMKQLYKESINEIMKHEQQNDCLYTFVDFGASHIRDLEHFFGKSFVVIDHHQPKYPKSENFLNCWHFGLNGSTEACAASLSYLVADALLGEKSEELASIAIIGALGDMQDSSGQLTGLNKAILDEAQKNGYIKVMRDLRLYGRFTRPLVQFIAYSTDPMIPGLTGNEDNVAKFLLENGFELKRNEKWLCYEDLSFEEKQKLVTALIIYMRSIDLPEWKITRLIGEVYTLLGEPFGPLRDAKEYATLLNACGRNDCPEVGLELCLGDRGHFYGQALGILAEHRKNLREGLELMIEEGLQEARNFYYFNAGSRIKDSLVGVVAGMLYSSNIIPTEKPIVAFAEQSDGFLKVSARATQELIMKGLNLGLVMRACCEELGFGSEGGGHQVAAGAKIPKDKLNDFIWLLDKKLGEHFNTKQE
ncbi:MAG: DHH family phosphoesterase [Candidatus Diapherotrites archaeon]